ncbi:MAG: hypothetical protein KDD44_07835, partial [Bdellovibrionales bacterium]|nr:hypothetical protein [Bdellovibrionales bacterium]
MKKDNQDASRYSELGVSASKQGLHDALQRAGVESSAGFFAQLGPDIAGDPAYISLLHCDGAGTKALLAYLYACDTNDTSVYASLSQDALVMNLDDILCVGLPSGMSIANAISRNARLIPDEAISRIIGRYKELVDSLNNLGFPLTMTGGETADMGDVVRTLVVDATIAARIPKDRLVDTRNICSGDVIIGLSSTGRASYEDSENSGIGSNGLTLARHALLTEDYLSLYPEVCDPQTAAEHRLRGPFRMTDLPSGLGMSIGKALLSPTRTYAPVLRKVFESLGRDVHGVIHCTGGGQTKVLRFGPGSLKFIKDNLFPEPPVFRLI